MSKEIKVTGRVPLSVRRQVKDSKNRKRKGQTLKRRKNKGIKKIKTPRNKSTLLSSQSKNTVITGNKSTEKENKSGTLKGIIQQSGRGRAKNKTVKKVRFNLESEGVQTGKFRNAHRVKMKTAKKRRNTSEKRRSKNRTSKNQRFKIRFSDEKNTETKSDLKKTHKGGDLVTRLRDFKNNEFGDIPIIRV